MGEINLSNGVLTVGLTGGIGSGKSSVARLWKDEGCFIFQSDEEGKSILVKDDEAREELVELFGSESYFENGALNRAHIASLAFEDPGLLAGLNSVVHPRVRARYLDLYKELESLESPSILVNEAALIYESGIEKLFDKVVVVWSPEELRLERVVKRDDASPEDVRQRMKRQLSQGKLRDRADYVIENIGSLNDLEISAMLVLTSLKGLATDRKDDA